jgi:mannose-6-phosphate isomerase-like protein (cupin superfamily)
MTNSFTPFEFRNGELFDASQDEFPSRLHAWDSQSAETLEVEREGSTFYGFVFEGDATLATRDSAFPLQAGMYFSVPEKASISGGKGILIERVGFKGQFMLGGPIEESGRLKYIDGCTDSLLIPPIKLGDPCLNALYFPSQINQTQHTHPSIRVGVVFSGRGECVTPKENIPLLPGEIFVIHRDGLHSFRTPDDSGMVVIAYHPDSDFGPEDQNHPMINRTIVEGQSASELDEIRTR